MVGTQDPLAEVLALLRAGQKSEGYSLLRRVCEQNPDNMDALALGAYELQIRAANETDWNEGQGYLNELMRRAPESCVYNSCLTLDRIMHDPTGARHTLELAKAASLRPETHFGQGLFMLADVAGSEAEFQVLCTPVGHDLHIVATPRLRGLVNLLERKHDEALVDFRSGATDAQETVTRVVSVRLSAGDSQRLSLNLWRDCLFGEGLTLEDQGHASEGMERISWAAQQYREAWAAVP